MAAHIVHRARWKTNHDEGQEAAIQAVADALNSTGLAQASVHRAGGHATLHTQMESHSVMDELRQHDGVKSAREGLRGIEYLGDMFFSAS